MLLFLTDEAGSENRARLESGPFCAKIVGALGDGLADTLAASDGSIHLWLPAGTAASPNFGAGSTLACACESGAADPAVFPFEETLSTDVNGASSAFFSRSSFAFASSEPSSRARSYQVRACATSAFIPCAPMLSIKAGR